MKSSMLGRLLFVSGWFINWFQLRGIENDKSTRDARMDDEIKINKGISTFCSLMLKAVCTIN